MNLREFADRVVADAEAVERSSNDTTNNIQVRLMIGDKLYKITSASLRCVRIGGVITTVYGIKTDKNIVVKEGL